MNIIQLKAGKSDYNRSKELLVCLFGVEAYVSRTRGGVWTVGIDVEWHRFNRSKSFWEKK
jgi:hypothetical protein